MGMSEIKSVYKSRGYSRIRNLIARKVGLFDKDVSLHVFRFASLPNNLSSRLFLGAMLGSQFVLYHEFLTGSTFLIVDNPDTVKRLEITIPGMTFDYSETKKFELENPKYIVAFEMRNEEDDELPCLPLDDSYTILKGSNSGLFLTFVPTNEAHVKSAKKRVEEAISKNDIRMTRNFGDRSFGFSGSIQNEIHHDSDQRKAYFAMLDTLNEAMLDNGSGYKISLILENGRDKRLETYLRTKLFILENDTLDIEKIEELYNLVCREDAFPFSYSNASRMLSFSGSIKRVNTITTARDWKNNIDKGISLGFYLDGSVYETGEKIKIDVSTLNLGTLITGLPGSGKTFAAMEILKQVKDLRHTKMIIVAPTEEWVLFGLQNKMKILRLNGYDEKINFFRCEGDIDVGRFYENLAMLIAHASNVGPYKNSIEKCLLSAFNKIYSKTRNPDPVEVYDEIEETVIERHGKRSSTGVKYTKHGENIRAGLENLRLMLLKPQFAYQDGIELEKLLEDGIIFDISMVSNNMKPFFYALALNQVYAHADTLDVRGNDKLRMLICLEEAQLAFNDNEQSAATLDLRQRIQDFRKKGIGLMLITHSVIDINLRIRRLCQTKMYFRQSADAVKYAAIDLIMEEKVMEELADRLKTLEHRTCVLNYISSVNGIKNPATSVFVRIPEYSLIKGECDYNYPLIQSPDTKIRIVNDGGSVASVSTEIRYVSEIIHRDKTDSEGVILAKNLLKGKIYKFLVFGSKKKETRIFEIIGGQENILRLSG